MEGDQKVQEVEEIAENGVDREAGVILQCNNCHLVIGDSKSWVGFDEEANRVILSSKISYYRSQAQAW